MSLSARDRQVLDGIAGRLAGSDPQLTAMMATFTRLTSAEQMPTSEKIRAAPGRLYDRLGPSRAALLLWLVMAVAAVAVALTVGRGSPAACPATWPAGCVGSPVPHSAALLP